MERGYEELAHVITEAEKSPRSAIHRLMRASAVVPLQTQRPVVPGTHSVSPGLSPKAHELGAQVPEAADVAITTQAENSPFPIFVSSMGPPSLVRTDLSLACPF